MIFYFSATGNSYYVAYRLSQALNEPMISIVECMKQEHFSFSMWKNETCGIVTPTYYMGLPTIVEDFLEQVKLHVEKETYCFLVATYGGNCGLVDYAVNTLLKKQGLLLQGAYSVKMPDVWVPKYDVSDQDAMYAINLAAETRIIHIVRKVREKSQEYDMINHGSLLTYHVYYTNYRKNNTTNHLYVDELACKGCGLCEEKCPVNAMKVINGKAHYVKSSCVMCLGCLHRCPKHAISYDHISKEHGQYINPFVKIVDL